MGSKTTKIAAVKQKVRLNDWATQIEAQQASGMTVQKWCGTLSQNLCKPPK